MLSMHAARRHFEALPRTKGDRGVVTGDGDFATQDPRLWRRSHENDWAQPGSAFRCFLQADSRRDAVPPRIRPCPLPLLLACMAHMCTMDMLSTLEDEINLRTGQAVKKHREAAS